MNKQKIILIGGGGHARSCIEVIESTPNFEIAGVLDNELTVNSPVLGYRVLGNDVLIADYADGYSFCVAVGQIKNAELRKKIVGYILSNGGTLPNIIASTAWVSRNAALGNGNIIMHGAFINAGAIIGDHNIINTGCLIEHDSVIGNFNHISTASVLNGACKVGNENFIGSRSVLSNGVQIENNILIGAGGLVTKDLKEAGTYVGVPVKKIQYA